MDLYINPDKENNRKYLSWCYRLFGIIAGVFEVLEKDYPIHVISNLFHLWEYQFIHTSESLERMANDLGFKDIRSYDIVCSDTPELQGVEDMVKTFPHGLIICSIDEKN